MAQEIKRSATGDRTASRQRLTVAVCLPTYNGERFLQEQLDSIAEQRAVPDELLVSDDHSTDSTVEIVKAFARSAPIKVRLSVNETNLGLAPNTARLVRSAESDVLFFADQDDIWKPDKVEKMLVPFEMDPGVEAVGSDSLPFDSASGTPARKSVWKEFSNGARPAPTLTQVISRRVFIAGHNLAVWRRTLQAVMWSDMAVWPDLWMALIFAGRGTLALVDEPLVMYRQHASNTIGIRGHRSRDDNIANWSRSADTLSASRMFLEAAGTEISVADAMLIREREAFLRQRVEYLRRPLWHVGTPLRLFLRRGGYRAYAHGIHSFAGDMAELVGGRRRSTDMPSGL
ncbi:MAG: glycosyltransferase [Actinomycetota bacterium]|nr:glycosyltransferase [Actinomycetota bacterium]